jgi:glycosyltransferase involved in cell wall biosynthesis
MRVGIDVSVTQFNKAGTARYSLELLKALQAQARDTLEVVELKAAPRQRFPAPGLARKLFVLYWEWLYAPLALPLLARNLKLDLLHCTAPLPLRPETWSRSLPVVTTLHDIFPVSHPEWFSTVMRLRLRRWIDQAIRSSQHVIVSSQFTKGQVSEYLKLPEPKMTVVYLGHSSAANATSAMTAPFLLTVGTLEPRKNLLITLEAYRQLRQTLPTAPPLVVVGQRGWGRVTVQDWLDKLGLAQHVRVLHFVPDEQLFGLYAQALALIYPSLAEGFGFPPLEAMACGCPVVVANTSSLPEVVGQAGLLVDPHNAPQIAEALRQILTDPALAERLREAGLVQAQRFTWERCARETRAVYRQVLEGRA